MKRLIEITSIVAILLLLVFVVGCKEKAEDISREELLEKANHFAEMRAMEKFLGRRFDEPPEPNVIEMIPPSPYEKPKIWFKVNMDGTYILPPEIFYVNKEGKVIEYIPKPEPNEPKKENYVQLPSNVSGRKAWFVDESWLSTAITKYIPTWPDYIELEKDLILDFPKPDDYPIVQMPPLTIIKGTKIYFNVEPQAND